MDSSKLTRVLADAVTAGQNVYVRTSPEILDFTDPSFRGELTIFGQGGNVVTVSLNEFLETVVGVLKVSVFSKNMKVIGWNWKSLVSYIKNRTGKDFAVDAAIIDLKVIESFAGLSGKAPESLADGLNRVKALVSSGVWKEVQPIYQKVHLPLVTEVVPALETVGVLNTVLGKRVYACYEVCGQVNGRLNSGLDFLEGFHPHSLSEDVKKRLKPNALDEMFMYFDFKNMEVSMLQWLSKDEQLARAMEMPDVYLEIYRLVTGIESKEKDDRNKAKKMFLPVIYGQSAQALGHRLKIALPTAEKIVTRIRELFPTALAYTRAVHEQAKASGSAKDIFGKRRQFSQGEEYDALGFSVQAPASTVCLEKLVRLYSALKGITSLAYSVHDGYCVYAHKENWKKVYRLGYDVLTGESSLCPGLRLKVTCHAGRNLCSLSPLRQGAQ